MYLVIQACQQHQQQQLNFPRIGGQFKKQEEKKHENNIKNGKYTHVF